MTNNPEPLAKDEVECVARAINAARYEGCDPPREPPPFEEEDRRSREHAYRLANAALRALQPDEELKELARLSREDGMSHQEWHATNGDIWCADYDQHGEPVQVHLVSTEPHRASYIVALHEFVRNKLKGGR